MKKIFILLAGIFCLLPYTHAGETIRINNITHTYNSQSKQLTINWGLSQALPVGWYFTVEMSDDNFNEYNKDSLTSTSATFTGIEVNGYEGFIRLYDNTKEEITNEYFSITDLTTALSQTSIQGVRWSNNIVRNAQHVHISVYDLSGARIAESSNDINMTQMPRGLYMVRVGKNVMKIVR